ncbi:hypothetical protein [Streptomyces celluloflavus]|uniref:hypothetical protein n=1 Tax=Streptomyces celluloflavus TaxID=58344 RepID=UPI00369D4C34
MISTTPNHHATALQPLTVSGPLRAVEAHADGSWTVTPAAGPPLLLTGPHEVTAYIERAHHGTGPAALAPAHPAPDLPDEICGCVAVIEPTPTAATADVMQARAIYHHLAQLGVASERRSYAWDDRHQAAAVRVSTPHGLYALLIPPVGRAFVIHYRGARIGALDARRVPATTDSLAGTLYATFLRDRGDL